MIMRQLQRPRRRSSTRRASAKGATNMPGNTIGGGEEGDSASELVERYAAALGFPAPLAGKLARKFKKHGSKVEDEMMAAYKRAHATQDVACVEELLLSVMPEKNKAHFLAHLYNALVVENEFFQELLRAAPDDEVERFKARLFASLSREHVAANRYLTVSPRGAVYVVRRGAVRIYEKGKEVATLERGAVFEVCALSDQFVTLHYWRPTQGVLLSKGLRGRRASSSIFTTVLQRRNSETKSHGSLDGASTTRGSFRAGGSTAGSDIASSFSEDDFRTEAVSGNENDAGEETDLAVFLACQNTLNESGRTVRASTLSSTSSTECIDIDSAIDSGGIAMRVGPQTTFLNGPSTKRRQRRSLVGATLGRMQRRRSSNYSSVDEVVLDRSNGPSIGLVQTEREIKLYPLNKLHICAVDPEDPDAVPDSVAHALVEEAPLSSSTLSSSSSSHLLSHAKQQQVDPTLFNENESPTMTPPFALQEHQQQQVSSRSLGDLQESLDLSETNSVQTNKSEGNVPKPLVGLTNQIYLYGAELGVISSDNLRAIVAEFASVRRNFDVLSAQVEVQIEKEVQSARRKQEQMRRQLELEHKQATNKELEAACRRGALERVQEAIDAGAGVNDRLEASGATASHLAALFGHSEVLALLLRLGADLDATDNEGRTALHLFCLVHAWQPSSAKAVLGLLLGKDSVAALQKVDQWGNTPLHLAASTGDLVALQELMTFVKAASCHPTVNLHTLRNNDGYTPLEICTSPDARKILKPKTHVVANLR